MSEELQAGAEGAAQSEANPSIEVAVITDDQEIGEVVPVQKTGNPKVDDPWPKSARNAMSRRDKQLGQSRAQIQNLQKQVEELTAAQKKANAPKRPDENDPEWQGKSYADLMSAQIKFDLQNEGKGQENPQGEQPTREQIQAEAREAVHYEGRMELQDKNIEQAKIDFPEFAQLEAEFEDVIVGLPVPILKVFLDADNAPAAFVALAKEGKLEQLANMNISQAAREIARAEVRGLELFKASKVSKAPAPINGVKGGTPSGKNTDGMSGKDLRKHYGTS